MRAVLDLLDNLVEVLLLDLRERVTLFLGGEVLIVVLFLDVLHDPEVFLHLADLESLAVVQDEGNLVIRSLLEQVVLVLLKLISLLRGSGSSALMDG